VIIKNGNYMPPLVAGYSITMKNSSVDAFSYPMGKMWQVELAKA
jgi:L-fuconate dehydratase